MARKEVTIRAYGKTSVIKKPKVPPLSELARILALTMRDYKVVFEKDGEVNKFCHRYVSYMVEVGKDTPGFKDWHNRASRLANELLYGPPVPVEVDPEIDIAYQCGWEASMHQMGHYRNPYDNRHYADCWRDGWTDASRKRGLVTRVN